MKLSAVMNVASWVRAARETGGFTQERLGELLGVTKANISAWENGRHEPSFEQLSKMSKLTGAELHFGAENVSPASIGTRKVPVLDHVQAGAWTGVDSGLSESDIREYVLSSLDLSPSAFAMFIRGDSMLPEFREGDMIIAEDPEVAPPRPGDFVVAVNGSGEATFKRYRERGLNEASQNVFELVPLNPDYPTMRSDVTHIRIVGTMMEHRKFRRK